MQVQVTIFYKKVLKYDFLTVYKMQTMQANNTIYEAYVNFVIFIDR